MDSVCITVDCLTSVPLLCSRGPSVNMGGGMTGTCFLLFHTPVPRGVAEISSGMWHERRQCSDTGRGFFGPKKF